MAVLWVVAGGPPAGPLRWFEEVEARHQVPEHGRVAERVPLGVDAKEGRENVPGIHGRLQALQRFGVSPERVQHERFMMRRNRTARAPGCGAG